MGFFDKLKEIGNKVLEKTADVIVWGAGKVIEAAAWVKNKWDTITKTSEEISQREPYDSSKSGIRDTTDINELIHNFLEESSPQASEIEEKCIDIAENYYEKIISIIENTDDTVHNQASLKLLKRGKKRISMAIKGNIIKELSQQVGIYGNEELRRILKMAPCKEKEDKTQIFLNKVFRQALENLAKNISMILTEKIIDVQEYLTGISDEQEKRIEEIRKSLNKFIEDKDLEKGDKEKNCVPSLYIIDVCDKVSNILD